VTYTVISGTGSRDVPVSLGSQSLLGFSDIFRIALALLHLGIGVFVLIRGAWQPRSSHFYLICLSAFVVYLYSYTPALNPLDWTVWGLSVAAFLTLPAIFLHFCRRFPIDPIKGRSGAPLLYLPAILLGATYVLWLTGHLAVIGFPLNAQNSQILDRIHLAYFCVGFLLGGITLLSRRAGAPDLVSRQQYKWLGYGTLAGIIPFSLGYGVPWLLGFQDNLMMLSSALFLGLIPLAFSYAVLHYRLLDVEHIARRGAAYFVASSLLLILYLFFVLVLGKALQWIAPEVDFLIICIAALTIALLFAPLKDGIQVRLDRIFYKDQFADRTSLLEFARTLSTEISLDRLSRNILERVCRTFQIERGALILSDPAHPGFYRITDTLGFTSAKTQRALRAEDLLETETLRPWEEREGICTLHRSQSELREEGLEFMQDLTLRGRMIGMIGLGPLPAEKHFSTEDRELLSALAGYAAIALENASLYRSVESKAAELERVKIYTENIIESINIAVLALDLNGKITSCNRAFEELYHTRRGEIRGSAVETLLPENVMLSIQNVMGSAGWEMKAPGSIFKLHLQNRQGKNLIVNLSIIPLMDPTDLNSGCLIVMDDITDKSNMEEQLLQVEKLSSLGLLAAGIAHEVNTPITGISSFTQMLLKETPESDHRNTMLKKIETQTFRAAEIVNGLLNFSRMNGSEFKHLDVNQLLQESLALLEHQLTRSHIRIQSSLDGSVPLVYGNAGKLQQVFVNLLLNAKDAMPSGGELEVKTVKNDTMVIVDINDTGVGISEENIRRIYDPFFTTKRSEKGTGLGLAVTYGIIQEHGGGIFVDSEPTKGTHFRLKLPTRQPHTHE
jgi:PAS domain S-box-containing protein